MFSVINLGLRFDRPNDSNHVFHHLGRVRAHGGFTRKHQCIRPVQYSIGHIVGFGSGGHKIGDHGLHHLGCHHHRLAEVHAKPHNALLD